METLRDILDAVARDDLPPADGRVTVVPQMSERDAGVLAFTAHAVVFIDEDPRWVHDTLAAVPCDALAAPMNPWFLMALLDRTGRRAETIDAMLVGTPLPGEPRSPAGDHGRRSSAHRVRPRPARRRPRVDDGGRRGGAGPRGRGPP